MDIFKILNDQDTLKKLGQSVGAEAYQVEKVVQLGLPTLLQALGQNASSTEGARNLADVLNQHKDDFEGSGKGILNNTNTLEGAKILKHIFADKNDKVQNNLAKETGLSSVQVSEIMKQLAPLLLGVLGQKKKEENIDSKGIEGLLGNLMKDGDKNGMMGMVTNILDSNKDGNITDDIGNILKGFMKK